MYNRKIRVLILGSDSSVKGGITSVINSFLSYDWNEIDVELLPTYIEGHSLNKILFFIKSIIKYLLKLMRDEFDIAHVHMSYRGSFFRKLLIIKLTNLFNKKVILHLHGSEFEIFYNSSNAVVKNLIKNIFECSDRVIVLGRQWKNIVEKISPKSKIEVFNNAIEIPNYTAKWSNDKINILFLGVLIKRKGIYELIEAIKLLDDSGEVKSKKLNFIICGSGQEEKNIKSLIDKYNLKNCINMVGWVDGNLKVELLKKSQLFVLPSYNEGLPMAILEAMSYGLPVVSTDVGSISEVVIDNETGKIIKKVDPLMIARCISEMISSYPIWKNYSIKSKKIVSDKFNESKYFVEIENLYRLL